MSSIQTLVLIGGISRDSINKKLFHALEAQAPSDFLFETFPIETLPFFSQDLEDDLPQPVKDLKQAIAEAEALLFVTPEYNRSIPGVLKNALDWGSRPYGQNSWDGKPAAVLGASAGNIGTFGAQHHLRQSLAYLNVPTMGQPEFYLNGSKAIDERGNLDERTRKFLAKYLEAFETWILRWNGDHSRLEAEPSKRPSPRSGDPGFIPIQT